jgi:hypothetical protein
MAVIEVSPVAVGAVIAGIFLSVWPLAQRRYCEGNAENYDVSQLRDTEFRVSSFAYGPPLYLVVLGIWAWLSAEAGPHGEVLFKVIGTISICGGIFLINLHRRSSVVFRDGSVMYNEGKRQFVIYLKDITEISFLHWHGVSVVVQTRCKKRVSIPLHFKNNSRLLAMLKYYRPESEERAGDGQLR